MMKRNLLRSVITVGFFGLMILSVGCARSESETSNLQVSLPQVLNKDSAMAAPSADFTLSHVIVNITGGGLKDPILKSWDLCQDCLAGKTVIPSPLPIDDVPAGGALRLVQVLAVYKNSASGEMIFYYGDSEKTLSAAEEKLQIDIERMGTASTLISGRVSGRYLTGLDSGPTSKIDIQFDPGRAGRPPLTIEEDMMVNGWFSVFMLSGVKFSYVLRSTGALMWDQKVGLDSEVFDPGINAGAEFDHLVKAFIPTHTTASTNGGSTVYSNQDPSIYVWGYWGVGASLKKVCTPFLPGTTTKIKTYSSDPNNYVGSSYLAYNRQLSYLGVVPTNGELLDTSAPATSIVVKGGANMTGMCGSFTDTASSEYLNFFKVKPVMMDGNGNDHAAGFFGIYRMTSGDDSLDVTGDPRTLSGMLLPGVLDVFNQIKVYKRVGSQDFRIEKPACTAEFLKANGFQAVATAGAISADGSFSFGTDISANEATSGVSAIFCPLTPSGVAAPFGHFFSIWDLGQTAAQ